MRRGIAVLVTAGAILALAGAATARVLRVGTYHGIRGQYQSLQAAVKAAHAGDWILVGPGDYKTKPSAISHPVGFPKFPAGVLITKARLHIRGMNRNTVIVDGTKPGSTVCSRAGKAQNFGYRVAGKPSGLNGLMVWKAPNVSIENLTACNFLGGSQVAGNQIWWNGGEAGRIGGYGYVGTYLSATSTYFKSEATAATYGIFSSNWNGGSWDQMYASNFNDSGYYIGACQQVCNQTMNHAHAQYNALGYSGSNAGGRLLIQNSEFDHNQDGFDTNSQNGDNPAPQNGACPAGVKPPVTGAHSCWVFIHNYVHDNNNPNAPASGSAAAGPVGTGMSVSGGRNDTVMNNRFVRNNAWGVVFIPYIDSPKPCYGGIPSAAFGCLWDPYNNALIGNTFISNGSYGHPSNGDFAELNLVNDPATNCYSSNHEAGGAAVKPASAAVAQSAHPTCDGSPQPAGSSDPSFLNELLCDTQVQLSPGTPPACPSGQYPRVTKIVMHPVPKQKTMKDPCAGVPSDPWCAKKKKA
jgi:hypothetical protein